jgi:hypothetical protein
MNKCYIAGPISGIKKEIYQARFLRAKEEVTKLGFIPVLPIELPHSEAVQWSDYMRTDIKHLMDCEIIYMINEWFGSKGARIEHELAKQLGLKIIYQHD